MSRESTDYELGYQDGLKVAYLGHFPRHKPKGIKDIEEYDRGLNDGAIAGKIMKQLEKD